jgi:DNA-binding CsgD family transcriptional regulator
VLKDSETGPGLVQELADGLRQAAAELADDGKPELAAAYLRQALALLPDDSAREALADLARLESVYDMRSAIEHFGALLVKAGDVEIVAEAASSLVALKPSTRDEQAWSAARDAIEACDDPRLKLRLWARIGVSAVLTIDAGHWRDWVLAQLRGHGTVAAGEKAALGVTSFFDLWRGRPLAEVQLDCEALFRDDWITCVKGNGHCFWLGLCALVATDSPLAMEALDEVLAYGRRQSASGYEGGTLVLRAHARLRSGDLAGAVADGRQGFETCKAYGGGPVLAAHALAAVVDAECQRGDIESARRALAHAPADTKAGTLGLAGIQFARARVRAHAGAPAVAFDELMRIGSEYQALTGASPALLPWRSQAALLAKQIGRNAEALELADAELAAAADAGPRALGRALSARAAVGPGADAWPTAVEAVAKLESVDAPLELAAALMVQGSAAAAAGSTEEARGTFTRVLRLAERTGAQSLSARARQALIDVGGRPRRRATVGPDSLTAAERAVARAAAGGLSNREIAASLNLAPGTVKNQLGSVYRKLSVSSRSQLAERLGSG